MHNYYISTQGIMPLFFDFLIAIDDPIHDFLEVVDSLNIIKYKNQAAKIKPGRSAYSFEDTFKAVLFGFMEEGYSSLRKLENKCKTDIRYIMLMNGWQTVGIIKHDKEYKRTVRRGKKQAELEIFLVCIGFNLAKCHNKKKRDLKSVS